jgi:predicted RNA-binding protein associated with RNAse of E/G family
MRGTVQEIKLVPMPTPNVSTMSADEIKAAYSTGLIVPKHLTQAGWSWRRISKELGKAGRKQALNFKFEITWLNGTSEELLPY